MTYFCTRGRAAWACAWLLLAVAPSWGQTQARATLVVRLPADARLTVDGQETKQTGASRQFYSPVLPAGQRFRYELEASWIGSDGKPVKKSKVVRVSAGDSLTVDLRETEDLPEDKSPLGKPPVDKKPNGKVPPLDEDVVTDVPYVPTPQDIVDKMLDLAKVKKDDVVYDLGCGDGRIVVTAAKKYGCKAVGYDIDPARVRESLDNVKKYDVGDLVTIEKKNLFDADLSKASVVTLYLLPKINKMLIPQLLKLKPGSRIVSHNYDIEGYKKADWMELTDKEGHKHMIILYTTPLEKGKE
jgi:uncharacterized protein (TIGR03000 family)